MRRFLLALLVASCAAVPGPVAQAQSEATPAETRFVAGQHYRVLNPALPTHVAPGKVEVIEIFWYGCPHCYRLSSHMQAWRYTKPDTAEFVRLPAVLNPGWRAHARLYFATRALGIDELTHDEIFTELHVNRNPLTSLDSMIAFLGRFDVSAENARAALTSFEVEGEVRAADARVRHYRLSGVPAVVINGKYVAGVADAGGHAALLDLINHLVALEAGAPEN